MPSLRRRGYDDAAYTSLYHRRSKGTDCIRGSRQVDVYLYMPVWVFHFEQRPKCLNSRIGKEYVDAPIPERNRSRRRAKRTQVALIKNELTPAATSRLD